MRTYKTKSQDRKPLDAKAKSGLTTYKRQKNNIEINGKFNDIKWLIWADIISAKLWTWTVRVLLFAVSKASLLPLLLQWLK